MTAFLACLAAFVWAGPPGRVVAETSRAKAEARSPAVLTPLSPTVAGPSVLPGIGAAAAPALALAPRPPSARLAVADDDPVLLRYLGAIETLKTRTWDGAAVREADEARDALADRLGLAVEPGNSGLVSQDGPHWLNRLSRTLGRTLGVEVAWSPSRLVRARALALYDDPRLFVDDLTPVSTRPRMEAVHELIHAYVARGPRSAAFKPLRLAFHGSFPGARDSRARFARRTFHAEEILTMLHTTMAESRRLLLGGKGDGDAARLLSLAGDPVFLIRAVARMSRELGRLLAARAASSPLRKRIGYESPMILPSDTHARLAADDHGWFESEEALVVRLPTRTAVPSGDARRGTFPVLFGTGDYHAAVGLPLRTASRRLGHAIGRRAIVADAAASLARDLSSLSGLTRRLEPIAARLERAGRVPPGEVGESVVREMHEAAREGFVETLRYFSNVAPRPRSLRAGRTQRR